MVQNREALDLWRQAADRPETSVRQPDGPDLLSGPSGAPFYALFRLGQLEASRQETEGNLDGAWAWHRACLRMIRHVQDYDPLRRALIFNNSSPVSRLVSGTGLETRGSAPLFYARGWMTPRPWTFRQLAVLLR